MATAARAPPYCRHQLRPTPRAAIWLPEVFRRDSFLDPRRFSFFSSSLSPLSMYPPYADSHFASIARSVRSQSLGMPSVMGTRRTPSITFHSMGRCFSNSPVCRFDFRSVGAEPETRQLSRHDHAGVGRHVARARAECESEIGGLDAHPPITDARGGRNRDGWHDAHRGRGVRNPRPGRLRSRSCDFSRPTMAWRRHRRVPHIGSAHDAADVSVSNGFSSPACSYQPCPVTFGHERGDTGRSCQSRLRDNIRPCGVQLLHPLGDHDADCV